MILSNFGLFVPNTPFVGDGDKGGDEKIKVAQKCISVLKFLRSNGILFWTSFAGHIAIPQLFTPCTNCETRLLTKQVVFRATKRGAGLVEEMKRVMPTWLVISQSAIWLFDLCMFTDKELVSGSV